VRRFHQRSGSFAVVDDGVVIYRPGLKKNWVIPARDVIWVHPEGSPTPELTEATIRVSSDPAIIPRLEVVQISDNEDQPRLCLVFRRPREVPRRHGKPRWADGAVLSAPEQAFDALDAAEVRSSPTLDDAVVSFYGTVDAPLISSHETQGDWHVSGSALTSRGLYSHDPKPVARHGPDQNASARERRQLLAGVLAGTAAAFVSAVVWAVFAYFTGWEYWLAAVSVGFAVGWTVRRHARSTTRRPGLGFAAALIAFAAMMAGSIFLQISEVAEALHVSVIRIAENPGDLDWGEILRAPFSDWLEWVFFAGSVAYAYALAASPHNGVATRIQRHPLRWVGVVLAVVAIGAGSVLVLGRMPLGSGSRPSSRGIPGSVAIESVQVGDCYNALGTGDVGSLSELPCAQPHDNEVFYIYTMKPGPYPGDERLGQAAEDTCSAHLGDYVSETAIEGLDFDYILPTQAGWDFGRRSALCSLHRLDGTRMTGTVRVSS
jgi:Septum formation